MNGKVAIITGGAQGIGESICLALVERGCKVCVCDVKEDKGSKLVESLRLLKHDVIFQKCDVSVFDSFEGAFERTKEVFGEVNILVNNAGIMDEGNWRKVIDVNFVGSVHGIHLAFAHMGTNNGGSGGCVINVASKAGLSGASLTPIYSATKHAVVGLTRSYGSDYHFKQTGVTVSAVCPGPTDTELFRNFPSLSIDADAAKMESDDYITVKPNVIADAVIDLIEGTRNGALLRVDLRVRLRVIES